MTVRRQLGSFPELGKPHAFGMFHRSVGASGYTIIYRVVGAAGRQVVEIVRVLGPGQDDPAP